MTQNTVIEIEADRKSKDYDFTPIEVNEGHLKKYVELLTLVFPQSKKFSDAFLQWQYVDNPYGTVVGFDAWKDGILVAHYATIPVEYDVYGKRCRALLSLNTATHPEHQGKGLFTKLAQQTYQLAQSRRFEFVIGVANANSTPGFLKKLDFSLIAPLDVRAGWGIMDTSRRSGGVRSHRTDEYLRWRLSCPFLTYRSLGQAIVAPSGYPLVYAQLACWEETEKLKLPAVSRTSATLWIGLNNRAQQKGLFFDLPNRLKPSPLNLIVRGLSDSFHLSSVSDIEFDLLDFDAY